MAVPLEDLRSRTALPFRPPPFIGSFPQQGQLQLGKPDVENMPLGIKPGSTLLHPSRQHTGWWQDTVKSIPTMMTPMRP
jgi:hypothetical protein